MRSQGKADFRQRLTTSGTITEYSITTSGSAPWEITSGEDGTLWFTEFNRGKIGHMSLAGSMLAEYSTPTSSSQPTGIVQGPDGAIWFTEFGAAQIGRIVPQGVSITATTPDAYEVGPQSGQFTIARYGDTSSALTVYYTLSGSATPDSSATGIQSVVIPAGDCMVRVNVDPIQDDLAEPDETVIASLEPDPTYNLKMPASATVIIHDTTVGVQALYDAAEAGTKPGKFRITRTGSVDNPLDVYYYVSGDATPGLDYVPLPQMVTIAAGESSVDVDVVPYDDSENEGTEGVTLTLFTDPNYQVFEANREATVGILDDDNTTTWPITAVARNWDPLDGMSLQQTGNVQVSYGMDLDNSPGTTQSGGMSLVYNSDFTDVRPIIQATIEPDLSVALPPTIDVELIWDGVSQGTNTFSTTGVDAAFLTVAAQVNSAVTTTGRHTWQINVLMDYPGTGSDILRTASGSTFVVAEDGGALASTIGAGWSFSGVDRLVDIAASGSDPVGKLRIYGTGSWRFYADDGSGGFTSPVGDTGTLVASGSDFIYTAPTGEKWTFNSAGMETEWESTDGQEVLAYTYSDADSDGQVDDLSGMTNIDGSVATFTYSGGLLSAAAGQDLSYTFTQTGTNLESADGPGVAATTYTYSSTSGSTHHLTKAETGPYFQSYDYTYGALSASSAGSLYTLTYNPAVVRGLAAIDEGRVQSSMQDAAGQLWTWTMDERGRVLTARDPANGLERYTRDSSTFVTANTDPLNQTTTYTRDSNGFVTQEEFADGSLRTYTYEATNHRMTTETNERGDTTTYQYDSLGHLTTLTNAKGETTTYAYYANGLLRDTTDARGNGTSYGYDSTRRITDIIEGYNASTPERTTFIYDQGDVLSSRNQLGQVTSYAYDTARRQTEVRTADNSMADQQITTTVYDDGNQVTRTIDALGRTTSYAYDAAGRMTGMDQDFATPAKQTTRYLYDAANRQLSAIDGLGRITSYAYDINQRLTTVFEAWGTENQTSDTTADNSTGTIRWQTDPKGFITRNTYDSRNRQTKSVSAAGTDEADTTNTEYDLTGNVKRVIDAEGRVTSYVLDSLNRQTEVIEGAGSINAITTTAYDTAGNVISTTDARGVVTSYAYDDFNRQTLMIEGFGLAEARTTTTSYDNLGNVLSVTDPLGHITSFVYDSQNRRTVTIEALSTADERRTTTVYDRNNNVLSVTNARGVVTSYAYDAANRQTQMIEAFGTGLARTTTTIYDNLGNVAVTVDARGVMTSYAYDKLNRQVGMTRAAGTADAERTQTKYDTDGNVVQTVDALGFVTTNSYDEQDRLETVTAPSGGITAYTYELVGNRTSVTDPLGNVTSYQYDDMQRVTRIVDARSGITTQDYDKNGNLVKVIDSTGNGTTFVYDVFNRETEEIDPNNNTITMVYDAMNMTSRIDRLGRITDFSYDNLNRLTGETWEDPLNVVVNTLTYGYDANNNELTAADTDGTITMTYDSLDRLQTRQDMFGVTLTNTYDANNNRVLLQDSKGGMTTSVYDALNRVTSRQFDEGTNPLREDFTYTPRDQVSTERRYSDLAGTTLVGSTSYAYDAEGLLTNLQHRDASGSNLANYTYTYDLGDRVTSETLNGGSPTTYTYDDTNELTDDGTTAYSYDLSGNRTMAGYSTTTGNRMTNDGVFTYTYDAEGNLIKKSKGVLAETWTFSYDHNNQLVGVEERATDGGVLQTKATYVYDALQNRIEKQVFDTSTTTTTRFSYDRDDVLFDLNGSNAVVTRYIHGDQTDEWLARISGTIIDWYLTDRQGSIRDIQNNATGLVIDTITYTGFGLITNETVPTLGGRIRYTGRELDPETGLLFNRARYYDPATGRWTTEDPIRWGGRDSNMFRYVQNSPTMEMDATGLYEEDVHFGMTYYIGLSIGLGDFTTDFTTSGKAQNGKGTISPAYIMAWADQYTDVHSYTEPFRLKKAGLIALAAGGQDAYLGFLGEYAALQLAGRPIDLEWTYQMGAAAVARNVELTAKLTGAGIAVRREEFHFPLDPDQNGRIPLTSGRVVRNSDRANLKVNIGIYARDAMLTGVGLHLYQDSWSHENFGPVAGHGAVKHVPDEPYRPQNFLKAMEMAEGTYWKLVEFQRRAYGKEPKETWDEIKPTISRLLKERGTPEQRANNWFKETTRKFKSFGAVYDSRSDSDPWASYFLEAIRAQDSNRSYGPQYYVDVGAGKYNPPLWKPQ